MTKESPHSQLEKYISWLIAAALGIKLLLLFHIAFVVPSTMMEADSSGYLRDAKILAHYFSMPSDGYKPGLYRTPGYPFFLTIFHFWFNLSHLSIIFLQFVLNIMTALVVFKTASVLDRRAGLLSAAIVLLDVPTTIYSDMIMTEALHLFVLALCLYTFVKYITNRRLGWLALAAVFLTVSVYVRPVTYFLGFALGAFVLYLWGMKKILTGVIHALTLLVLVYGILGIWQYQNLKNYGEFVFCSIGESTIEAHGIIGSYAKETDPKLKAMPAPLYYAVSVGRNFLELMTTPGNMKYFHSKGWRIFGAVFGYFFVIFWWTGLIACVKPCKIGLVEQFLFLVLLYFIAISIVATGWLVTPRFRVPMLPAIAVLSARGWMALVYRKKT